MIGIFVNRFCIFLIEPFQCCKDLSLAARKGLIMVMFMRCVHIFDLNIMKAGITRGL